MKYGIVFVLVVPEVNPETKMLVLNLGDNTGHTSKEEGGCSRKGKKDNKGFFFFFIKYITSVGKWSIIPLGNSRIQC